MDRIKELKDRLQDIREIKKGLLDASANTPAPVMATAAYFHGYHLLNLVG